MKSQNETLRPDGRGRITLGNLIDEGVTGYKVVKQENGVILLSPMAEIPLEELWLHKNEKAMAMVRTGLKQAASGETVDVTEDYSKYIDED